MSTLAPYTALANLYTLTSDPLQFVTEFLENHRQAVASLLEEQSSSKFIFKLQAVLTALHSVESMVSVAIPIHHNCPDIKPALDQISEYKARIYQNKKLAIRINKAYLELKGKSYKIAEYLKSLFTESFLTVAQRAEHSSLSLRIAELESKFAINFQKAQQETFIHVSSLKEFDPLPPNLVTKARDVAKLNNKSGYWFDLTPESYEALLTCSRSSSLRAYIYKTYVGLATSRSLNNEPILRELIYRRSVFAKNYGYSSYTDYVTSHSSLSSVDDVLSFLTAQRYVNEPLYQEYKKNLAQFGAEHLGLKRICPWDQAYVRNKFNKFYAASNNLTELKWSVPQIFKCIANLITELFGIQLNISCNLRTWRGAPIFAEFTREGQLLGKLVLDLADREGKSKSGAYAMCVCDRFTEEGDYAPSEQLIVMSIPTAGTKPSLNYTHVIELFHEFGHVLHVLLTHNESICKNHTQMECDAMEFPSQWFEVFASEIVLIQQMGRIAGKRITKSQALKIREAKNLHRPAYYWHSMINSEIDFLLNAGGDSVLSKRSIQETISGVYTAYGQFLPKYNKLASNQLNHFFMGSLYYGYLWTEQMVDHWLASQSKLSLAEQGRNISILFNKCLNKSMVELVRKQK